MQIQVSSQVEIEALLRKCSYLMPMIQKLQVDVPEAFNSMPPEDDRMIGTMLNSPHWPVAIEPSLIVNTEEQKMIRADNIISSLLYGKMKGIKFLDFGCGQGHVAYRMAALGADLSIAYDSQEQWHTIPSHDRLVLTTDLAVVQGNAPYNKILIYDVLDHSDTPMSLLRIASELLGPGGKIHLRCHPWCSRHGGHLYRYLNRAYAHLFLSDQACNILSEGQSPKTKVKLPLASYAVAIKSAGLSIVGAPEIIRERVEPFFQSQYGVVIQKHWGKHPNAVDMMGIQFIDYTLKK